MGKLDDDKQTFLPIFWSFITKRQQKDYELAQKHFGPLYRIQDTNYFMKKFKEYQANPGAFKVKIGSETLTDDSSKSKDDFSTALTAPTVTIINPNNSK